MEVAPGWSPRARGHWFLRQRSWPESLRGDTVDFDHELPQVLYLLGDLFQCVVGLVEVPVQPLEGPLDASELLDGAVLLVLDAFDEHEHLVAEPFESFDGAAVPFFGEGCGVLVAPGELGVGLVDFAADPDRERAYPRDDDCDVQ
ncbi:hypothetical protein ADL26_15430, partial [Thermoactinomyces vulgaris]